jgi:hypothetical protein
MDVQIKTGIDAIRARTYVWCRKHHPGTLSRDCDIPIEKLEAFACNKGELTHDQLNSLARELLEAKLDPESGLLRPLKPPPETKVLCTAYPERFNPDDPAWSRYLRWTPPAPSPSPPKPATAKEIAAATAWRRRPGWEP